MRDYADIYLLTSKHEIDHHAAREALLATASFRGTNVVPLSSVLDNFIDLRRSTYTAYRASLGPDGADLPMDFGEVVAVVIAFADHLAAPASAGTTWRPIALHWNP